LFEAAHHTTGPEYGAHAAAANALVDFEGANSGAFGKFRLWPKQQRAQTPLKRPAGYESVAILTGHVAPKDAMIMASNRSWSTPNTIRALAGRPMRISQSTFAAWIALRRVRLPAVEPSLDEFTLIVVAKARPASSIAARPQAEVSR
jgi:hypothetical protein